MTPESRARRVWALGYISRCSKPPPSYGTAEWLALPDGPEKVAAVVIAAESWAMEADFLIERLTAEVTFEREAFKADEDAAFQRRGEEHRERWAPIAEVIGHRITGRSDEHIPRRAS